MRTKQRRRNKCDESSEQFCDPERQFYRTSQLNDGARGVRRHWRDIRRVTPAQTERGESSRGINESENMSSRMMNALISALIFRSISGTFDCDAKIEYVHKYVSKIIEAQSARFFLAPAASRESICGTDLRLDLDSPRARVSSGGGAAGLGWRVCLESE